MHTLWHFCSFLHNFVAASFLCVTGLSTFLHWRSVAVLSRIFFVYYPDRINPFAQTSKLLYVDKRKVAENDKLFIRT